MALMQFALRLARIGELLKLQPTLMLQKLESTSHCLIIKLSKKMELAILKDHYSFQFQ